MNDLNGQSKEKGASACISFKGEEHLAGSGRLPVMLSSHVGARVISRLLRLLHPEIRCSFNSSTAIGFVWIQTPECDEIEMTFSPGLIRLRVSRAAILDEWASILLSTVNVCGMEFSGTHRWVAASVVHSRIPEEAAL